MTETVKHPLERFPNAVLYLTLPMTGLEVVIRRVEIEALTMDGMRTILSSPALREVASEWAAQAAEASKDPTNPPRPTGEMELEIASEVQRSLLRNAVIRPSLDELIELYGGRPSDIDLGMGPDYKVLKDAVDAFSKSPVTVERMAGQERDAQREAAERFPEAVGGDAAQPGKKLRGKATPVLDAPARNA